MDWRAISEHFLNSLDKSLTRSEQRPENAGQGGPLSFHWDEKFCKGKSRYRLLLKMNREEGNRDHLQSLQILWFATLPSRQPSFFLLFSSFPLQIWLQTLSPGHSPRQWGLGVLMAFPSSYTWTMIFRPIQGLVSNGGELADRLQPQLHQLAITLSGQERLFSSRADPLWCHPIFKEPCNKSTRWHCAIYCHTAPLCLNAGVYDSTLHQLIDINGVIRRQLWKLGSVHT